MTVPALRAPSARLPAFSAPRYAKAYFASSATGAVASSRRSFRSSRTPDCTSETSVSPSRVWRRSSSRSPGGSSIDNGHARSARADATQSGHRTYRVGVEGLPRAVAAGRDRRAQGAAVLPGAHDHAAAALYYRLWRVAAAHGLRGFGLSRRFASRYSRHQPNDVGDSGRCATDDAGLRLDA